MNAWNEIYSRFDPVAFEIFGFKVHWYGLCYVAALLIALFVAKRVAKKDKIAISASTLESYFLWVEIGVILGARIGYIFIYDPNAIFYITHPWQIFNPFSLDGEFVGIRGMSYHGAVIGFVIATMIFCRRKKVDLWQLLDLVAIAVPAGYIFGRIGNFLNQELIGRPFDGSWAVLADGALRHPSQLYEAALEGLFIFLIILWRKNHKRFNGELIAIYCVSYGVMRYVCEIFREPDAQLGFIIFNLSMGQILSVLMGGFGVIIYFLRRRQLQKI